MLPGICECSILTTDRSEEIYGSEIVEQRRVQMIHIPGFTRCGALNSPAVFLPEGNDCRQSLKRTVFGIPGLTNIIYSIVFVRRVDGEGPCKASRAWGS